MRFDTIIRKLQDEREALDQLIASLEQIKAAGPMPERVKKRRGRTFMAADERAQVAERMRKYWAARRMSRIVPSSPTVTHAAV